MTIKIGLCGSPGSGKSTCAADVFVQCKKNGIKVELIQEFARMQINKGWKINNISEQFIINKNQREMEDIVPATIDVLVTDSPAFLTFYYALVNVKSTNDNFILVEMYKQFLEDLKRYDKIIFLNRVKPYVVDGTREQTEEESDEISKQLKILLDIHKVKYIELDGNDKASKYIIDYINITKAYHEINTTGLQLNHLNKKEITNTTEPSIASMIYSNGDTWC